MKCTECAQECFENDFPEVVFSDSEHIICEECSIDYDDINGTIVKRKMCEGCGRNIECCECGYIK